MAAALFEHRLISTFEAHLESGEVADFLVHRPRSGPDALIYHISAVIDPTTQKPLNLGSPSDKVFVILVTAPTRVAGSFARVSGRCTPNTLVMFLVCDGQVARRGVLATQCRSLDMDFVDRRARATFRRDEGALELNEKRTCSAAAASSARHSRSPENGGCCLLSRRRRTGERSYSWARNSVRKLLRLGLIRKTSSGTYALAEATH
jgi:hypothetical protein